MATFTQWIKGIACSGMFLFIAGEAASQSAAPEPTTLSRGYRSESASNTEGLRKSQVPSSIISSPAQTIQKNHSGFPSSLGACEIPVTFPNVNLSIPDDDQTGVTSSQTVSGISSTSLGVDIQLKQVCFTITHTWIGDLTVMLTAPNGVSVILADRPGFPADPFGCDGNNLDVCVEGGTTNPMEDECNNNPAISGLWTAEAPSDLNKINFVGGDPNGIWQLMVIDNSSGDTGSVAGWSLIFDDGPVALWNTVGDYCETSGILDLSTLVFGTPGGTWSGPGVTGNNFNPAGISGVQNFTYTVTDIATGCIDSCTYPINVGAPPVVGFTPNVVAGTFTVNFTNTTTGNASYTWEFGDGSVSTDTNTTHTYAASGIYTVILTAINACGQFTDTQQVTVQGCPDLMVDGGFENNSPSWVATSTNFGTPVCTIALCGNGSGTGPYAGSKWAWFGGSNTTFEEATMRQSVNIPVGNATLYFQLEQIACDSPNDFLKIAVDQDTVFVTDGSSPLCGIFGYSQQSVNLNAYADGQNHTIKFFSRSYVTNGGASNFFVDNVELRLCTFIGVPETISTPAFEIAPNPANNYVELTFNELQSSHLQIRISDISGKEVFEQSQRATKGQFKSRIETSGFSKGVYVVTVISGNATMNRKLIIQ